MTIFMILRAIVLAIEVVADERVFVAFSIDAQLFNSVLSHTEKVQRLTDEPGKLEVAAFLLHLLLIIKIVLFIASLIELIPEKLIK